MKYKITDLMDLYEDPKCPFDPSVDQGQKIETQKETIEVKQTKHRFGWKEGLSLAAALGIVVLGGFGVKRLMDRRAVPPVESSFSPGMAESSSSPEISEPEFTAPDPNVVKPLLNPLLTAFAQQYISDSDQNLAGEYELACFAHLYAKLNDREAIRYQTEGDDPYETLSLEQVNETLTRLLGKTVSPEEGTDYTLQRGDNYAIHEQYHDGTFWWPAADGDPHDAFAIGYILDNQPYDREGRIVLSVAFTVYEPTDFDTDIAPLLLLTPEEAQAKAESGALRFVSDGQAWVEYVEDHLQMVQYELIDADPDTPHTEPTGFDPVPEADWAEMGRLANALAQQGITDLEADLSDEYALVSFAHIYTKIYDRSAITYQNAAGEGYETLTLEQVNSTLNSLFGKSVSPAEGTDYTLQRDDNYAVHEQYHDGTFWFPAADGEIRTRFAVPAYVRDAGEWGWEIGFEVFEADLDRWPEYPDWDQSDYEAIRGFHEEGKLHASGTGTARFLKTEDGLQISAYHVELADQPETPQAETQPDEALTEEIKNLFREETGWYCRALSSIYARPEDVNLYLLFYDGISGDSLTDAELKALYGDNEEDRPGCGTDRLPADQMNEVLIRCFGLGLEETAKNGLSGFAYLPETDCWYHCHGDTNIEDRRITAVRLQADGTVLLTYEAGFWYELTERRTPALRTAALRPVGSGQYQILSNLPGEWVTAEDLGGLSALFRLSGPQRAESRDADGTVTVRELDFLQDGEFRYREGDPDSEFSYWAWGQWWVTDDHSFHCAMCETKEDGNRIGPWYSASFACAIDGDELVLTQMSETGFRDDAPGTELRFAPAAEE